MKYLILFFLASTVVAASSMTVDGKTYQIAAHELSEGTLTITRVTDADSTFFMNEATNGKEHKEITLSDSPIIFNDAVVTSIAQSASDEAPMETIAITYSALRTPDATNCAQDICSYLQEDIGLKAGSTSSVIPFNTATINVASGDQVVATLTIKDKTVESITCCMEATEPTHTMNVKELQTLKDIHNATSPSSELSAKLGNDEVTIKATSIGGKISLFFGKLALRFL